MKREALVSKQAKRRKEHEAHHCEHNTADNPGVASVAIAGTASQFGVNKGGYTCAKKY